MILVTGGAGFCGSRIVTLLASEGVSTRALVRRPDQARGRLPAQGVEIVTGDTTDPESLEGAVAGVETIIHTAFITADRKQGPGVNYQATNVGGTANLVTAARAAGVRRIVVLGGLGTKSDKPGSYMQGRFQADQAVKQSGLAWSILGPSIQFGKGSAFFNGLANLIRTTPVIVPMIGNGKRQFQPILVDDVARCIIKMAREPEAYDGRWARIFHLRRDSRHADADDAQAAHQGAGTAAIRQAGRGDDGGSDGKTADYESGDGPLQLREHRPDRQRRSVLWLPADVAAHLSRGA
jgi:uncharacterized protein YbjT (DUF2867 family)